MTKFNVETKVWESTNISYPYPLDTFLGDEILRRLKETPDRVAQIFHDENREVTYKEFRISSVCIAQNLMKYGIKSDDVVGVICRNSHEVSFFLTACVLLGAPINPLDHSFTKDDIKHLFAQTQPKIIICDIEVVEKTQKALQELELNSEIFVTTRESTGGLRNIFEFMNPTGNEEDFVAPKFDKKADEKLFAILCSSGTTGLPKGVKVTHFSVLVFSVFKRPDIRTRSIVFSPIYWGTGFYPIIMKAFDLNDTRIFTDKPFSVKALKEIVEKYKLTNLTVPPMHLNAILDSDFHSTCNHNSLKSFLVLGSIASEALRKKFSETFPEKSLNVAYGMTEVSVSFTLPGEYKEPYSVGSLFLSNLKMKIVDDDGNRLGIEEIGELCVRADCGFAGYYNNSEASTAALDSEGFLKSGDLGYFNDKNCLFIIDRKKEILKYKGHQINPSEIENVIEEIEGVELVSVVGIPDENFGSLSTAAIKKKQGFEVLSEKFIIDYVATKLSINKQLHGGVFFVDNLPQTASGKLQKRFVKNIVMNLLNDKRI